MVSENRLQNKILTKRSDLRRTSKNNINTSHELRFEFGITFTTQIHSWSSLVIHQTLPSLICYSFPTAVRSCNRRSRAEQMPAANVWCNCRLFQTRTECFQRRQHLEWPWWRTCWRSLQQNWLRAICICNYFQLSSCKQTKERETHSTIYLSRPEYE